jgi:hypothetical protein
MVSTRVSVPTTCDSCGRQTYHTFLENRPTSDVLFDCTLCKERDAVVCGSVVLSLDSADDARRAYASPSDIRNAAESRLEVVLYVMNAGKSEKKAAEEALHAILDKSKDADLARHAASVSAKEKNRRLREMEVSFYMLPFFMFFWLVGVCLAHSVAATWGAVVVGVVLVVALAPTFVMTIKGISVGLADVIRRGDTVRRDDPLARVVAMLLLVGVAATLFHIMILVITGG